MKKIVAIIFCILNINTYASSKEYQCQAIFDPSDILFELNFNNKIDYIKNVSWENVFVAANGDASVKFSKSWVEYTFVSNITKDIFHLRLVRTELKKLKESKSFKAKAYTTNSRGFLYSTVNTVKCQ
ncbi:MAG: hypothetical protein N4A33_05955 [Bacteriovoracaceae bacterium]|jgi:hypothetical protein|nr:hypothetical protein [Bacteriovoracaceae bacterium]